MECERSLEDLFWQPTHCARDYYESQAHLTFAETEEQSSFDTLILNLGFDATSLGSPGEILPSYETETKTSKDPRHVAAVAPNTETFTNLRNVRILHKLVEVCGSPRHASTAILTDISQQKVTCYSCRWSAYKMTYIRP